ncbi:MAG TPA: hypothetical protein VNL18_02475, partial [Gemmatimonadales bacterium]|nr:hypothetical protein [Gemmatimonadales bacterium]
MALSERHRRELIAIVALLLGVFVGLTLLPLDVTGPAGRFVGGVLWRYLGLGAAMLPLLGLAVGLAGFGRFGTRDIGDVTPLFLGLVLLVPFTIALVLGIRQETDLPADHGQWTVAQQLVGILPAALLATTVSIVGTAGAIIVLLIALSGLTMVTLDWHPFRRLAVGTAGAPAGGAADQPGGSLEPEALAEETAGDWKEQPADDTVPEAHAAPRRG